MKVNVKPENKQPYPILKKAKINTNLIVLFNNDRNGVVLATGGSSHNLGDFVDVDSKQYEPFYGSVTLEN